MRYLALLLILLCFGARSALAADSPGPRLLRGVDLHGPLTWGRASADGNGYLWPVYEGARYDIPINLMRQVRAAGFDFIRLSIDPGPLLAFEGEKRDALYGHLKDTIAALRADGFDVLVDFHPIKMVKAYSHTPLEAELLPAYIDMIRRGAHMLAQMDMAHVAIEPMNEPELGEGMLERQRCQAMMVRFHDAIRSQAQTLTIVMTGGQGGSLDGLFALDPRPLADPHTLFSFHYYLPYVFTHQGIGSTLGHARIWPFITGLTYPAERAQFDLFWPRVQKRVRSDEGLSPQDKEYILADGYHQLKEYFEKTGNPAAIHADFDRVSAWAAANGVDPRRIFLGEFGVTQDGSSWEGAPAPDRLRWITDVRQEAEKHRFHWSFWALYGPGAKGMTLVSPHDDTRIDQPTANALGVLR